MRTAIQNIKTINEEIITCDFCNVIINCSYSRHKCCMCKKDICHKCVIYTDNDYLISGNFSGDCPDSYCKICWSAGEEERNKILKLREQKELEEDILWQQWKGKCK
ncbi:MAG: hypothetical protein Q7R95_11525 [bacterium]|nr:hypothetical protein [bacterium]